MGNPASRYAFLPGGGVGVEIVRTEGCFLITSKGQRILDAAGGAVVSSIGHGRVEVGRAMAEELALVDYVVPPFVTPSRTRLVDRLKESWLPDGITRCVFTSGGSEAVDTAIRIARQHFVSKGESARYKIIGRRLSYHGVTLATLAVGGHEKRKQPFTPLMYDHPKISACYALRCELCEGCCNLSCAEALRESLEREGPETVAAFIAEPVGGSTAGALVPPDDYLPRVAEICREYGVLFIADEVMCGFGRTGRRFAVEHYDVVPDLLVSGKGLAAGYAPIAGVFAREEVVEPIAAARDEVMFFTFSAHPGACAAADAVLEIMEREALVERAAHMGELLRKKLERLKAHPNVAEVRGLGLLQAIELVRDRDTLEPFPVEARMTGRVVAAGLARGVFYYPGGCEPARDVICLGPPFTISEAEIELLVATLEESIDAAVSTV